MAGRRKSKKSLSMKSGHKKKRPNVIHGQTSAKTPASAVSSPVPEFDCGSTSYIIRKV